MIPKILEYEDRRVKVTAQAYAIPELKAIIDKYDNPEPYLSYIHAMVAVDSPYTNIPAEEKNEAVIYDTIATLGEFDSEDELLTKAIESLAIKYETPMISLAKELENELHRFRMLIKTTPLTLENFRDRKELMKDIEKISTSYEKVKKQAIEELQAATKGDHELGGY